MKAGGGQHFEQSHNAQAAVEVESRLVVGQRVSQAPNDKKEPGPTLASIPAEAGPVAVALLDSGFFNGKAVTQIERTAAAGTPTGTTVYAAVEKTGHHRSVSDLEKKPGPEAPSSDASVTAVMRHPLRTTAGQAIYKLRQQTVEPVFWDHQERDGVPAIPAARPGAGRVGMDAGVRGLQPQTAAPVERGPATCGRALKKRRGPSRSWRRAAQIPGVEHQKSAPAIRRRQAGRHLPSRPHDCPHSLFQPPEPSPTGC